MNMTHKEAIRIDTNFYTFRIGVKPESMVVTMMEPADSRIALARRCLIGEDRALSLRP